MKNRVENYRSLYDCGNRRLFGHLLHEFMPQTFLYDVRAVGLQLRMPYLDEFYLVGSGLPVACTGWIIASQLRR